MGKKIYVLDTNVLLSDTNSIFSFEENEIIIPMVVLEELDKQKSRQDEVGKNARHVSRTLDDLRTEGNGSLIEGIKLKNGGLLRVDALVKHNPSALVPYELQNGKNDNLIIAYMVELKNNNVDATLVSKDINVRIKCDSLGVKCEDYRHLKVTSTQDELYTGVCVVSTLQSIVNSLFKNESIDVSEIQGLDPYPNQIVILKSEQNSSVITRCIEHNSRKVLIQIDDIISAYGMKPRNKEQKFALDLLYDPDIKLLTLIGPAGTGKTLLTLAAAIDQLAEIGKEPRYNKLVITKPIQSVGKEIGFLPGTLEEKMEPWIAPIKDNLNFLMGSKKQGSGRRGNQSVFKKQFKEEPYLDLMKEKGFIEIEAISFIRGRSIPNAFIIIDEAQNLTIHELKTILTRAGEGTKIVLTGDVDQIDNFHVDIFTNGLSLAVERFKEHKIAGHITLIKGERSELATLASKIL